MVFLLVTASHPHAWQLLHPASAPHEPQSWSSGVRCFNSEPGSHDTAGIDGSKDPTAPVTTTLAIGWLKCPGVGAEVCGATSASRSA